MQTAVNWGEVHQVLSSWDLQREGWLDINISSGTIIIVCVCMCVEILKLPQNLTVRVNGVCVATCKGCIQCLSPVCTGDRTSATLFGARSRMNGWFWSNQFLSLQPFQKMFINLRLTIRLPELIEKYVAAHQKVTFFPPLTHLSLCYCQAKLHLSHRAVCSYVPIKASYGTSLL